MKLISKIKKMKSIKEKDLSAISLKCKNININDILKMKNYIKFIIIFLLINICFFVSSHLLFNNQNQTYIIFEFKIYYLIINLILMLCIIILNSNKKSLLNKRYYNENRIAQKLYNAHLNQIVYYTDIISFKLINDIIINIPVWLFVSLETINIFKFIATGFIIMIYIFIGGNVFFSIDKEYKEVKLNKCIKNFFCYKKIHLHFTEKEHRVLFDEFNFEYSIEEQNIINNSDLIIVKSLDYKFIDDGFSPDPSIETSLIEMQPKINDKSNIIINNNLPQKKLDFKLVSEFYLVQKLLMIYFKKNEEIYHSSIKNMEETCTAFKKFGEGKNSKKNIQINTNLIINNIDRISTMSINDVHKLISSIKISQSEIFTSFEEKELFEEIRNKFNIKNENYTFTIESLLTNYFFELFPFYQMDIKSILKSMNPSRNIKVFSKFIKRNEKSQKQYSIYKEKDTISVRNNYYNNNSINDNDSNSMIDDEDLDKKDLEQNLFYTHDLFLMYEIYEKSDFIKFEDLKYIIIEYNNYLLSAVKNMSYSFLPLILGVFNLNIYDSNLIIILYRNPLYFTGFNKFNHWINFYITEKPEKIKVSSMFNDIININEIEIENSLELSDSDYEEIRKNLENDYHFIEKMKNIYPIIHLFIGDEIKKKKDELKNINSKNIFYDNSFSREFSNNNNEDMLIFDMIRDSSINDYHDDEINDINEVNSLYDKEYFSMDGNNIRTIKIYFTNLFRKECKLNSNDFSINSKSYCKYLQGQLINYLIKKPLFKEDKEEEDKEEEDE
jgi:hypothetical protein